MQSDAPLSWGFCARDLGFDEVENAYKRRFYRCGVRLETGTFGAVAGNAEAKAGSGRRRSTPIVLNHASFAAAP
jgi:hypothetical protein